MCQQYIVIGQQLQIVNPYYIQIERISAKQMRPYLKHDNYHMASQMEAIRSRAQHANMGQSPPGQPGKQKDKDKNNQMKQSDLQPDFDTSQAFKFQIQAQKQEIDFDQELKLAVSTAVSGKKPKDQNSQTKKMIFTPRCTLKQHVEVEEPDAENIISAKQKADMDRKNKHEMWKLSQNLKKILDVEPAQANNDKKTQAKQQGQDNKQKQCNSQQAGKKSPTKEEEGAKAKTTGKKKKIKKQANYVKMDLKRKYRDRFVGGINKNLRMLTKGGKMKRIYGRNGLMKSEIQLDQQNLYNSYTISLSKALFVKINVGDESDSEQQKLVYQIPKTYQRENLQKLIHDIFGFKTFREGQYETIRNILQGKSTLFVSQTASGKSLTYLLASIIQKGLSIIVSPLVSLMLDQIDHLPSDLPAACISSLLDHEQKDRIVKMVKQGKIQLLYITPQSFLTDFMYHVRQFPPINFVCIDQAHSMSQLSHSFRAAYLTLQDIVLKHFIYKSGHPVILCLTATANLQTQQSIQQKLNIFQTIRSQSTINKNLFVTISRQKLSQKYQGLLNYLSQPQIRKCRCILVYCRTKRIMGEVSNYLRNSGMMCSIYHSGLEHKEKIQTLEKFRRGVIKIVIATVALGMGLDFQNLDCVIHINMPKSVENYIQQIGRAGRRQKRAYCHLFLDQYDYFTQRNYFLADQLQPKIFEQIINVLRSDIPQLKRGGKNQKKAVKHEAETESLKRLSLNEQQRQEPQANMTDQIYDSQQQLKDQKPQSASKTIKDAEISNNKIQEQRTSEKVQNNQVENKQLINEKQQPQINLDQFQFKPLGYCKADLITQKAGLKQQAILNILLKIQKNLGRKVFKIFPMSYETLKISYFRKNEQQIKKQQSMYRTLIDNCKVVKGAIHIPLITKCNQFKISPIRLLSEVYGFSNKYCLKIELVNQVFVWQHQKSPEYTFDILQNKNKFMKILKQFNMVQRTALTKFNIFYCLCFDFSAKNMRHILQKKQIISDKDQLPSRSIINAFDGYFKQQTYQLYNQIVKRSQVYKEQSQQYKQKPQDKTEEQAGYLPITAIDQSSKTAIQQNVQLFIRHVLVNNPDKKFLVSLAPYRDGRIITRVFMGVNDTTSNWKTYGEHPYWMKFVSKDYRELLKTVRQSITNFIVNQGPILLALQQKQAVTSKKKQPVQQK